MAIMQNSILISDAQVRPAGISVNEGIHTLKCAIKREAKRLWATKSEAFSYLCEESVSYGDVAMTIVGIVSFVCVMIVGGYLFGGEVM
jgi:hypothetical protein